jgi:hypothetical protein
MWCSQQLQARQVQSSSKTRAGVCLGILRTTCILVPGA